MSNATKEARLFNRRMRKLRLARRDALRRESITTDGGRRMTVNKEVKKILLDRRDELAAGMRGLFASTEEGGVCASTEALFFLIARVAQDAFDAGSRSTDGNEHG